MIVLRQFSLIEKLKGNPALKSSLLKYQNISISDEVLDEFPDLDKNKDTDFLKVLSWVYKNIKSNKEVINTDRGTQVCFYSFSSFLSQLSGKSPFGIQKYKEPRIVVARTNVGDDDFIISYIPGKHDYIVTRESMNFNILSRGINRLFGEKGPQVVAEYKTFREAWKYINDNVIVTTTYYSDHSDSWKDGEETKYQKNSRKVIIPSSTVLGLGTGATIGQVVGDIKSSMMNGKLSDKYVKATTDDLRRARRTKDFFRMIKEHAISEDANKANAAISEAIRRLNNSHDATEKFAKKGSEIVKGTYRSSVGKGIALGTLAGLGAGVGINEYRKHQNIKFNKARRNKNDNTKK